MTSELRSQLAKIKAKCQKVIDLSDKFTSWRQNFGENNQITTRMDFSAPAARALLVAIEGLEKEARYPALNPDSVSALERITQAFQPNPHPDPQNHS